MRRIAIFAITALLGCVYCGVTSVQVLGAMQRTVKIAPCDLSPAPSASQARVQVTCVRATQEARRDFNRWHVRVPSDSCSMVDGNTFVYDCTFSIRSGATRCHGVVRVRGRSSHPARLHRHLRGISCVR